MSLKIGFTYDTKEEYPIQEGELKDKIAEFDSEKSLDDIVNALSSSGHEIVRIGNARCLINEIALRRENYDLIFNIAEGLSGRGRESQVPCILELFNIPYAGSDPTTMGITLDKYLAKKIVLSEGVRTPRWIMIKDMDATVEFPLKFPVIVKPSIEGTSKGITKHSLVRKPQDLETQVERILTTYKQPVLVEEFVSGKEFTVLVMGNSDARALPPAQVFIKGNGDLGDDFYTADRVESKDISYVCAGNIPSTTEHELTSMALAAFHALGCRDFCSIDFRVDHEGRAFFLECNPLPNISKNDVFPIIAERLKMDYNQLIVKMLDTAIKRCDLKLELEPVAAV